MCIFLSVNVVLMNLTLPLQRFGTLTQAFRILANQTSAYVRAVWSVSELSESHEPKTRVTVCTTLKESDKKIVGGQNLGSFWAVGQTVQLPSQVAIAPRVFLFFFHCCLLSLALRLYLPVISADSVSGGYLFGGQHCQDMSVDVKIILK